MYVYIDIHTNMNIRVFTQEVHTYMITYVITFLFPYMQSLFLADGLPCRTALSPLSAL